MTHYWLIVAGILAIATQSCIIFYLLYVIHHLEAKVELMHLKRISELEDELNHVTSKQS